MTSEKKVSHDYTATQRSARREERIKREGGKRLPVRFDGMEVGMLKALNDAGYAENESAVVKKAVRDAYAKLKKKG